MGYEGYIKKRPAWLGAGKRGLAREDNIGSYDRLMTGIIGPGAGHKPPSVGGGLIIPRNGGQEFPT